ncbi:DUF6191 domain-containing protein [Streptomyces sp. V1I6]|uniref:DUF6191 domain-containing protein n=1 Tax=Streptomyces sp. V1I6 TaxID=3042273 RepID=UPI00277FF163|nr:hypothetical protein [Streptomyces sp. V1I6]
MFNAFEEIFAPGRKHTDDERNRLALTRVDVGDGDPGRGPIDLDSGKVTVRATDPAHPDPAHPNAAHPNAPAAAEAPAPDARVGRADEPGAAAGAVDTAGTADAVATADAAGVADGDAVDGPQRPASRRVTPPG